MRLFHTADLNDLQVDEQNLLQQLVSFLEKAACSEDADRIRQLIEQLERPFLLVVVGEYNSGKSSFINALLGQKLLEVKSIPTTSRITRLKYSEEPHEQVIEEFSIEKAFPIELLKDINLVDTPGTNSIIRHHQKITEDYIHQSELILFITSTDRPFTESERLFLELIKGRWERKVIFILNKTDLKQEDELAEITEFLEKNIYKTLDFEPHIYLVSAVQALEGKIQKNSERLAKSRIEEIERYLFQTLDQRDRLYLKLVSPLKVANKIELDILKKLDQNLAHLNEQMRDLDQQSAVILRRSQEMESFFSKYLAEIESVLLRFEKRILDFLDRVMTLPHLVQIRANVKEIEREFREEVVGKSSTMDAIEEIINDAIDYVIRNNKILWEDAIIALSRYQQQISEESKRLPALRNIEQEKGEIFRTIRDSSDRSLKKFDIDQERENLKNSITQSLKQLITFEGLALGAGITVILSTLALVDISGIILGSIAAVAGFVVIPQRRRKAKQDVEAKIQRIIDELQDILVRHLRRALSRLNDDIQSQIQNAQRLCATERDLVADQKKELNRLLDQTRNFINQVESVTSSENL